MIVVYKRHFFWFNCLLKPQTKWGIRHSNNDVSDVILSGIWIAGVTIGLVNSSAVQVKRVKN